jgi:hypothetical protein
LIVSLLSIEVGAIDLGVKGKVFDIDEIDIRLVIMEMVSSKLDVEEHQKDMIKKSDNYYRKLPHFDLLLSRKNEVNYIDPTKVYEDDYWSLSEDNKWVKLVESGQEINWLEHTIGSTPIYFVFDYDSEIQREIAKGVVKLKSPFLKVVFIGGDLKKANSDLGFSLTYLNSTLVAEYDIEYTPLVIKRGSGDFKNHFKKTRFNMDEVLLEDVSSEIIGK